MLVETATDHVAYRVQRRSPRRLADEQVAQLVDEYQAGATAAQLAIWWIETRSTT